MSTERKRTYLIDEETGEYTEFIEWREGDTLRTKEQREFIPTPLAAKKNIKKVGVGIVDQLISADYVRNADETKSLLDEAVEGEFEPSSMNIVEQKLRTTGLDFKSVDPRVLREE